MSNGDKTLVCVDCQAEFVHSAADQQRYAERGFTNEPKRCPDCRMKRKASGGGGPGGRPGMGNRPRAGAAGGAPRAPRQFYSVTCAECGKQTEVPFKPTEGRPVYCRDCFQTRRPR
ncbi:MAG: zinc-ribbon domain containing protein [Phycisphaerae bacterium]|nr:zinc-ribbon domain containing protein [Phycisphaerae bacterium]